MDRTIYGHIKVLTPVDSWPGAGFATRPFQHSNTNRIVENSRRERYCPHRSSQALETLWWILGTDRAPIKHSKRHPLRIGTHQVMVGDPWVTAGYSVQPMSMS